MTASTLKILSAAILFAAFNSLVAQPAPGDVFREYRWFPESSGGSSFLRVGGRLGYDGGPIAFPQQVDLEHASKAEAVIEKLLCHDGTRGLAISINGHEWIPVPEAPKIPEPQWDYQHHTYPVASLPLSQLASGPNNTFRLRVSPEHPWKWPQNLIYGVHIRVYYDPAKKPHPAGRMVSPAPGSSLGKSVNLEADANGSSARIRRVDFLGLFEDVNFEGDGEFRQWHYHYFRGRLTNHIGTVSAKPFQLTWETGWVPDQSQPFELAAWITDESELSYFTEAVAGLKFVRPEFSVELCKPYNVPKKWVTRAGELEQKFSVTGDPGKVVAARLVWSSWSSGYMNGIFINGKNVFDREGQRYAFHAHRVPLTDLSVFVSGENTLKTGRTPKYNNQMVHGMEVNWPGIMVLIKYKKE